jgi:hypothetical protein
MSKVKRTSMTGEVILKLRLKFSSRIWTLLSKSLSPKHPLSLLVLSLLARSSSPFSLAHRLPSHLPVVSILPPSSLVVSLARRVPSHSLVFSHLPRLSSPISLNRLLPSCSLVVCLLTRSSSPLSLTCRLPSDSLVVSLSRSLVVSLSRSLVFSPLARSSSPFSRSSLSRLAGLALSVGVVVVVPTKVRVLFFIFLFLQSSQTSCRWGTASDYVSSRRSCFLSVLGSRGSDSVSPVLSDDPAQVLTCPFTFVPSPT